MLLDKHKATLYAVDMGNQSISDAAKIVGGQANLARLLNVSAPTVNQWVHGHRPVPADRCPDIERVTAGQVTCERLRPDLAAQWGYIRQSRQQPAAQAA